jgi:hypothetical protein
LTPLGWRYLLNTLHGIFAGCHHRVDWDEQ